MDTTFAGKKIIIMGLGLHGGGLSAAKWFFAQGAKVTVTDLRTRKELGGSVDELMRFSTQYRMSHSHRPFFSIEYKLGEHDEKDLEGADLLLQNPGVPNNAPFLLAARKKKISIENEASIFFVMTEGVPKIGVTGTKGKSTTCTLLYEIFKRTNPKAILAGNIGTVTLFEVLDDVLAMKSREDVAPIILELSSWQLEHLAKHKMSPSTAVLTNIMPDHLNRHGTMEHYIEAKKNIYVHQKEGDSVVMSYDNTETFSLGSKKTTGTLYWFSLTKSNFERGAYIKKSEKGEKYDEIRLKDGKKDEALFQRKDCKLPGDHLLEKAMAAAVVARINGVKIDDIRIAIKKSKGAHNRLEHIADIEERSIYNDTTATTPDATIAALATLNPERTRKTILICGGADKGLEFEELAKHIKNKAKATVLLSGTATPKIGSALYALQYKGRVEMANSMHEAVQKAWNLSEKGDTIVLSPGAASFGMFTHEFERGDVFRSEIQKIQGKIEEAK